MVLACPSHAAPCSGVASNWRTWVFTNQSRNPHAKHTLAPPHLVLDADGGTGINQGLGSACVPIHRCVVQRGHRILQSNT
jgi:hypothetical protein